MWAGRWRAVAGGGGGWRGAHLEEPLQPAGRRLASRRHRPQMRVVRRQTQGPGHRRQMQKPVSPLPRRRQSLRWRGPGRTQEGHRRQTSPPPVWRPRYQRRPVPQPQRQRHPAREHHLQTRARQPARRRSRLPPARRQIRPQLARRRSHPQPAAQRRGWQRPARQRALRRELPRTPVGRRPAPTPAQGHRRQAWRRLEPDRRPQRRHRRRT